LTGIAPSTPKEPMCRFARADRGSATHPELVAFDREQGFVPTFAPPERVRTRVVEETPRWAEIIRAANPQLD
jgi:hypothetical protein